jgi:hypothetical protein
MGPELIGYIDAGSGSYLYQMLIAGIIGCLYVTKTAWKNLFGFAARLFERTKHSE